MARHHLDPAPWALHGYFSRELPPALTIDSGDVVSFQTLDAGWGAIEQEAGFSEPRDYIPRDLARDVAHPLAGPVAINGARAGMTLEIRINRIRTGRWGWSAGPGAPAQLDPHLGLGPGPGGPPAVITVPRGDQATFWELDPERAIGINRLGQQLKLRPFMGVMGMPLDQPGTQSTFPPTRCGGNLDCRELTEGTVLFLPIAVDGGLFSTGDGHAVQGDGEVAGPALNCPMQVEMEFRLHAELRLALPRARQTRGWLTFGFGRSLDEAAAIATVEMVKLMGELYGFSPRQALSLASLVVDLRITQMVNGVRGVHALLRDDSIEQCTEPKA
jgi:acetamidase/formamidase